MRRYLGYSLIVVAILTMAAWGISVFVQPTLSNNLNSSLIIFFAALLAVSGVLANLKEIAELLRSLNERKRTRTSAPERDIANTETNSRLRQSLLMRLRFLNNIDETSNADELEECMIDLVKFIERLGQGPYFAQKIADLAVRPRRLIWFAGEDDDAWDRETEAYNREYRAKLIAVRSDIRKLIDELMELQ